MISKILRIHGDNIVECERSLQIICDAIAGKIELVDCPIFLPKYHIANQDVNLIVELLPGHGRWGVNIGEELNKNGGILREGADSYISEIIEGQEIFLLAIEYCSALPAGNNAWQRNGRALSSVLAGVPYLYMAELGGVELDSNRRVKSARYPNPIVPFSYLCTTIDNDKICLPVYKPHPSISEELYAKFSEVFGFNDCLEIIRRIIHEQPYKDVVHNLANKTIKLVELLSKDKSKKNILSQDQWKSFLYSRNRSSWIRENTDLTWKKKTASKVVSTLQLKKLLSRVVDMGLETIGASDIPICIVPKNRVDEFVEILNEIYLTLDINIPNDKPLVLVWITGYKPKGDDSRPDRGLCPLAKMIIGDSCHFMSIVYGPAKPQTWSILNHGIDKLAESNGLWQSIYKICDFVLVDSVTKRTPEFLTIRHYKKDTSNKLVINYNGIGEFQFSEQDIDTAIHQILIRSELKECLCNPPGGDWSGISYYRFPNIYRWTSLPRVSEIGGKRPDHVFQKESNQTNLFIAIESKGFGNDLENNIGTNLCAYLQELFGQVPTSIKRPGIDWRLFNRAADLGSYKVISAGAFIYKNDEELVQHLLRGKLDCIIAIECSNTAIVHLITNRKGSIIKTFIKEAAKNIGGFKIKVHRF